MDRSSPEEHRSSKAPAVRRMLEARSIAVVGASARTGSFGERLAIEALRSPARPRVHLVNPRYSEVLGRPCLPTLADIDDPIDLVLLGTPDSALVDQLALAAARGDGGAVVFGTAAGLAPALVEIASDAGLALCGAGCMGFVNVDKGVRALGYIEQHPQTPGPISLVTHSGSVFSALLRTHRRLEFALAVSSGQELVTTTGDYLAYALDLERTRVVALYLETIRDAELLKNGLARAASRDIPVVALTVGASPTGRAMVSAHSGAIAGDDAAWEALFDAYGVHRVRGLDEMADTLELFAIGRRVKAAPAGIAAGIATVHDSGAERAMVSDVASAVGVPFGAISAATRSALEPFLDPGLIADNPLDVWGRGTDTERLFTGSLLTLARDPAVSLVAVAVDLIREYDGDAAYPLAVKAVLDETSKPVVVLSNIAAAVDQDQATELRALGVPVLEGTESGLRALRHLLHHSAPPRMPVEATGTRGEVAGAAGGDRRARWIKRISQGPLDGQTSLALLAEYGVSVASAHPAVTSADAVDVAERIGYPVVLKTDEPAVAHKSDVGGVVLDLYDSSSVAAAWAELAGRHGPRVVVQSQVAASVELAVGVVRDPLLGPLVVLAAGGTLIELLSQRRVALPPLDRERAAELVAGLAAAQLLDGVRGRPAADRAAFVDTVMSVGQLAVELGEVIEAVDVNPVIVGPSGAIAVDALVIPRSRTGLRPQTRAQ